jgi:hypothetical protein
VRPDFLNLQLATRTIVRQGLQTHARMKPVWDISVQLGRNLTPPSLGLENSGKSNELVGYSRISSVKRL